MKYFGTDGIRGIINKDLNSDLIYRIGRSLKVLNVDKIYIGYDTRESNTYVFNLLVSGILSVGIDVVDSGIVSTPSLVYFSNKHNACTLMITASHNPYYYNGIKIFKNGEKLSDEEEELIEANLDFNFDFKLGKLTKDNSVFNEYIYYLSLYKEKSINKVTLVLSYVALVYIASKLFNNEDNISLINKDYNGVNINDNVGSLHIDRAKLNDSKYLFSFDGDGDRILFKDNNNIYEGDLIVYLLAIYYKLNKVVLTENVNLGLLKAFEKRNIKVYISSVGDKNVYNLMIKENCLLGGENSGHIINLKYMNSGDGLLNFLIISKIINEIDISKYLKDIKYYPSKNINLGVNYKIEKLTKIKEKYKKKARVNIRKSGTENVIRVNICSKKKEVIDLILKEINSDG